MASSHRVCFAAVGLVATLAIAPLSAWAGGPPETAAIDRILGQIGAPDEAVLREALAAMERAEAGIRSGQEGEGRRRFEEGETLFVARLTRLALPEGTRAALRAGLADYSRQALGAAEPRVESLAGLTGR